jgi:hypothetical protein
MIQILILMRIRCIKNCNYLQYVKFTFQVFRKYLKETPLTYSTVENYLLFNVIIVKLFTIERY